MVLGASEEDAEGTGLFSSLADRTLSRIEIPSLVVRFPADTMATDDLPDRILVPVTRSASARAAEEMAYSLVGTTEGSVVAMHVVNRPEGQGMMLEQSQIDESMDAAVAMLADAAELGAKLGVRVTTSIKVARNAEEEIVDAANSGDHDLLLLGTAARPLSGRAFFGHRVNYIIENASVPVAIVSLPELSFSGGVRTH
jgi:nucleotide-binding universal stress UspA family protein